MVKFEKDEFHDLLELTSEEHYKKSKTLLDFIEIHPLMLELGPDLIPLVDPAQGGDLLNQFIPMRVRVAMELGFIMPGVIARDNIDLVPNEYLIRVKGIEVARGEILMGYMLAIQQPETDTTQELAGATAKEPVSGNPALWITGDDGLQAEQLGYMVMDPMNVLLKHFEETVKNYGYELLSRQDVDVIINKVREKQPAVVKELIPELMTLREVQRVLQSLLKEKISIRDIVTILEALTDNCKLTKDTDILTEICRHQLAKQICATLVNEHNIIPLITMDMKVEAAISKAIQQTAQGAILALKPQISQQILKNLAEQIQIVTNSEITPVLLCNPQIRLHVKKLTERNFPNLVVLSYNEIAPKVKIQSIANVNIEFDNEENLYTGT